MQNKNNEEPAVTMVSVLPRIPTDLVKRNLFRGCLLGGAVGDALGAPVEFMSRKAIMHQFGEPGIRDYVPAYGKLGAITDDTQMTLFTADGMLRGYVRYCMRGIGPVFASVTAHAYLRWLITQGHRSNALLSDTPDGWLLEHRELFSRRAPGITCIAALKALRQSGDAAKNDSKGCGGVMRVAPVGMFIANWLLAGECPDEKISEAFSIAAEIAAITHGHPAGQLTAGVFSTIVALILAGMPLAQAIGRAKIELRKFPDHEETLCAIEKAEMLAVSHPSQSSVIGEMGEGWIAEEALAISLYCALSATDFESGVVLAVNHDGDSDSTGAITGNLLGAVMGLDMIPSHWLENLELGTVITEMADDLATVRQWDVSEYIYSPECDFYWNRYPGV